MRVALVGGGAMAAVHLRNLRSSAYGRPVAVTSPTLSPACQALADEAGLENVSFEEVLRSTVADAVVVASPTPTHAELVCLAVAAGVHVFCEKPLCRDRAQADAIATAAKASDAKVAVGHVVRYFPEYETARDLIVSGSLGRAAVARLWRGNRGPGSWYQDRASSGGPILDMAVHDLDWCLWALGPAERVFARESGTTGSAVAAIVARHTGGAISYIDASWREPGFVTSLEVAGTGGIYRAGGSSGAGLEVVAPAARPGYVPANASAAPPPDDPYRAELEAALAWFAGGPAPRAVLADGLAAVELALAAGQSAARGQPVLVGAQP